MPDREHIPAVAEHFGDRATQEHASRLGMWVFLGSETLLFAGLFGLYTAYRAEFPREFYLASHHNNVYIGTANTLVLITSSFTVAWALHAIRGARRRTAALAIGATLLFGAAFLVLKSIEYAHHFAQGIFPGAHYRSAELPTQGAALFFTLYYFMTSLHALHVIAGMAVLAWLLGMALRGRFSRESHMALENGALYWHLVDVVWIFLWPLLYLTG